MLIVHSNLLLCWMSVLVALELFNVVWSRYEILVKLMYQSLDISDRNQMLVIGYQLLDNSFGQILEYLRKFRFAPHVNWGKLIYYVSFHGNSVADELIC